MGVDASAISTNNDDKTVRSKVLADVGAWAGNVGSCVAIVFVNKLLMNTFHCHFATTLVSKSRDGGMSLRTVLQGCRQLPVAVAAGRANIASSPQTALHFLACSTAIWAAQRAGKVERTTMPFNGARWWGFQGPGAAPTLQTWAQTNNNKHT
jgi:hypothetical protein